MISFFADQIPASGLHAMALSVAAGAPLKVSKSGRKLSERNHGERPQADTSKLACLQPSQFSVAKLASFHVSVPVACAILE